MTLLYVKNLTTPVLKNVSFTVKKGAIFGIIGESGAGKTSLLRTLVGLEKNFTGTIFFPSLEGKDITKNVGMIFQHFNLFSARTVLENITYPLEISGFSKEECKKRAKELLLLVGLERKEKSYPALLSGGEKQRVAIARALALNPALLLSDEATSALDPTTKKNILSLLLDLNQRLGLTIILITHEMAVIKEVCTEVLVLEKGAVVELGPVEELFLNPSHPTTRKFLKTLSHDDIPKHLWGYANEEQELWELHFKGMTAEQPIIHTLIKQYEIEVNILLGGIDMLRTVTVGNLLVAIKGPKQERNRAYQFLQTKEVGVRRI